jgi:hypothetical protein
MAERHHFRLKLPNGAEVDFGGDKEFVTEVYRDTKAAAVTLFNKEASRSSPDATIGRLLNPTDGQQQLFPIGPPQAALLEGQPTTSVPPVATSTPAATPNPQAGSTIKAAKEKRVRSAPDAAQQTLKKERLSSIDKILKAQSFDEYEIYIAAIDAATNAQDRAALVIRMAETKFELESGLSPAEVHKILNDRFRTGQENSALKKAMKDAPKTFFADGPAPFDGRARLYKTMKDGIERVNKLLEVFRNPRVTPAAPASNGNGNVATN